MSESKEMYLVTIARLNEAGITDPVSLTRLADEMEVLPVSVNQMIHKLVAEDLIEYTPYKGASLTDSGRRKAHQLLRFRRLWVVFLVNHLGYSPIEADTFACRLEHIFPDEAAERLAGFLDYPTHTPSGETIPPPLTKVEPLNELNLSELSIDQEVIITRVLVDPTTREFLASQGLADGGTVYISAVGSKGDILLRTSEGNSLQLSNELVKKIFVSMTTE